MMELPPRNKLIGAMQLLRLQGAYYDTAAGQKDMDVALAAVDAYCAGLVATAIAEEREQAINIVLVELDSNGQAQAIVQAIRARSARRTREELPPA